MSTNDRLARLAERRAPTTPGADQDLLNQPGQAGQAGVPAVPTTPATPLPGVHETVPPQPIIQHEVQTTSTGETERGTKKPASRRKRMQSTIYVQDALMREADRTYLAFKLELVDSYKDLEKSEWLEALLQEGLKHIEEVKARLRQEKGAISPG